MPGLFGFVRDGATTEDLASVRTTLHHHVDHAALPLFREGPVLSGLVLRRQGRAGGYVFTASGAHVWIDGEAYDENGLMPPEALAEALTDTQAREGLPPPLNGNFAAVVFDASAETLRFITDPFGLKFLYVRMHPAPAWCGELQGFLRMPGPAPEPDPECVAQILEHGHPLGDRTHFRHVKLLDAGTVTTFDLRTGTWSRHEYFMPGEAPHSAGPDAPGRGGRSAPPLDRSAAAVRLGRLIRRATARRVAGPDRVGITLSGGLDSRALLAAVPTHRPPPETVTFGVPGCPDDRIAARAAAVRGSPHVLLPVGSEGWLEERAHRVPLTDGHISILDLHGMESLPAIEARMDVCLHGFLGDALPGGSYLDRTNFSFRDQYRHRGRRLILQALHFAGTRLLYRTPFLDLELARLVFALPEEWLRGSRLYNKALLREFPEYFRDIPWEKTGLPPGAPKWRILTRRVVRRLRKTLGKTHAVAGYTNYPEWLRRGADARYLKTRLAPGAAIEAYMPRDEVDRLLREHACGADHSVVLGRLLTLEVWFQHVRATTPTFQEPPHEY